MGRGSSRAAATITRTLRSGGENGFTQAIELSSEMLANVKFVQEKRLIGRFFEEISQDSGKLASNGWGSAN